MSQWNFVQFSSAIENSSISVPVNCMAIIWWRVWKLRWHSFHFRMKTNNNKNYFFFGWEKESIRKWSNWHTLTANTQWNKIMRICIFFYVCTIVICSWIQSRTHRGYAFTNTKMVKLVKMKPNNVCRMGFIFGTRNTQEVDIGAATTLAYFAIQCAPKKKCVYISVN